MDGGTGSVKFPEHRSAILRVMVLFYLVFLVASASAFGLASGGSASSGWTPDRLVERQTDDVQSPSLATGPDNLIHAVWQRDEGGGDYDVYYSRSSDFGVTWENPVAIGSTSESETDPEIAVAAATRGDHPARVFIAFRRRGTEMLVARSTVEVIRSTTSVTWQVDQVSAAPRSPSWPYLPARVYGAPSIAMEHDRDDYYVYVAFTESDFASGSDFNPVARVYQGAYGGTSEGSFAWTSLNCIACSDSALYAKAPRLAYQSSGASRRLYIVYAQGADGEPQPDTVRIRWLDDRTTWSAATVSQDPIVFSEPGARTVSSPVIAASRDGDTLVVGWVREGGSGGRVIHIAFDEDPVNPGEPTPWRDVFLDTPDVEEVAPILAADGEGAQDVRIGGGFHIVWTRLDSQPKVLYSTVRTNETDWTVPVIVSDEGAIAAQDRPDKGLTTYLRDGRWYPAVAWRDWRGTDRADIYFSTPVPAAAPVECPSLAVVLVVALLAATVALLGALQKVTGRSVEVLLGAMGLVVAAVALFVFLLPLLFVLPVLGCGVLDSLLWALLASVSLLTVAVVYAFRHRRSVRPGALEGSRRLRPLSRQ